MLSLSESSESYPETRLDLTGAVTLGGSEAVLVGVASLLRPLVTGWARLMLVTSPGGGRETWLGLP